MFSNWKTSLEKTFSSLLARKPNTGLIKEGRYGMFFGTFGRYRRLVLIKPRSFGAIPEYEFLTRTRPHRAKQVLTSSKLNLC